MTTRPTINTSTRAVVTVQVEVTVGSWGPGCKLEQVYGQASLEATNRVRRLLGTGGTNVKSVKVEALTTVCELR